jgi:hypothetical protein
MKPLFTVHAGEFLVGCEIEKKFPRVNVWLPGKDTGIDLLLSNKDNTRMLPLQVKFSRDYLVTHIKDPTVFRNLRACGWWTPTREHIKGSPAQYWVFVLLGFSRTAEFIFIKPDDLLRRLVSIRRKKGKRDIHRLDTYFWVTQKGTCFETRDLDRAQQVAYAQGKCDDDARDFTQYLNNWKPIKALNK